MASNGHDSEKPVARLPEMENRPQAFVKFFGDAGNRASRMTSVLDEVRRSGSHWACTYPRVRRPSVQDGAVMFIARLVKEPADILIYGRALGKRHDPEKDDATPEDIVKRPFKTRWPHYVRVHKPEFVSGLLANGVSLKELMDTLQSDAFASTQRNAARGAGNADPRKAYSQQPHVELTTQAFSWLNQRLQLAFERFGKLSAKELAALDWAIGTAPAVVVES